GPGAERGQRDGDRGEPVALLEEEERAQRAAEQRPHEDEAGGEAGRGLGPHPQEAAAMMTETMNAKTKRPTMSGTFQAMSLEASARQCTQARSGLGVSLLQLAQTRRAAVGSRPHDTQRVPLASPPQ